MKHKPMLDRLGPAKMRFQGADALAGAIAEGRERACLRLDLKP